jgi:hypothetical protein
MPFGKRPNVDFFVDVAVHAHDDDRVIVIVNVFEAAALN